MYTFSHNRWYRCVAAVMVIGAAPLVSMANDAVSVVERPPAEGRSAHYAANREPLAASMFVKLPAGSIKPRGWLRKQLELQAAGFHGYLWELSPFVRRQGNAWLSPTGEGHSPWEEMPYWLKGFSACAFALDDERMLVETKHWIEGVLAGQRDDGWFGPRANLTRVGGKPDLWPNMVMLNCLQSYHEYTGDKRVLELMTRYFRWQHALPEADLLAPDWQKRRAGDNIQSVYWLYNRTGEPWLLELAAKLHKHTHPWVERLVNLHNVDVSQAYDEPATAYVLSKNPRDLLASYRRHEEVRDEFGQVPGGMFGGDENCRSGFGDPRQAIETCGIVEEMHSNETMLAITGDPAWADQCEYVAFNSLPAALTADMKALRYLTSPNMIVSDAKNKSPGLQNGGNMLEMNPHTHRCCQHNFGHGWPYFSEHLWMATADNGLAAVMYSACDVKAKVGDATARGGPREVTIRTATRYPFEEHVEFHVSSKAPTEFPLYLRVPAWCDAATVTLNGKKLEIDAKGGRYVRIARKWSDGDRVAINLPMHVTVKTWEKNKHSVSVDRGPLTFSLEIGEKATRTGGTDRWPAWSIEPTTPWNYGLVLDADDPTSSFEVVARDWPDGNMPFTHDGAPITLKAKGCKIPQWKADYLGLVGLLQESPAKTSEPVEEITLIPMGAARLRIAAFPVASDAADAHEWVVPPEALAVNVSASHCWQGDTVVAVADGRLPKNSDDHTIPRFTWWPRRGTSEWIAREFDEPRKLSRTEVYWFDDEPTGGRCRTPASWRLLYRKGDKWLPVENASAYGVEKDKFNAVKFDEVETDALRIEVQLREDVSGGVLEWRVPEHVVVCRDAGAGGYEAFPDVCRLSDGRLMAVFYAGYGHVSLPNEQLPKGGRIAYCTSDDEGRTWSAAQTLYDSPDDDRDPSIVQLKNGQLICNFFSLRKLDPPPKSGKKWEGLGTWIITSDDLGKTWSTARQISADYYCSSPIRELSTGRLILGLYAEADGSAHGATIHSDDGGRSWSKPAAIDNGGVRLDAETDLIELADGTLFAAQRPAMCSSVSKDGGLSWSKSQKMGFEGHCPYFLRTKDDIILLAFRLPQTSLRYSTDECRTWSENVPIDDVIGAYPSMVNLRDGTVLVVYYEEGRGSNIRARRLRATKDGVQWLPLD